MRDTLGQATTFAAAVQQLSTTPLIGDVYLTVGGLTGNEGVIIARNASGVRHATPLGSVTPAWYIVQTNYGAVMRTTLGALSPPRPRLLEHESGQLPAAAVADQSKHSAL